MADKKQPTEKQLLDQLQKYRAQLCDSKTISNSKFQAMQVALLGAEYIINDAFGSPRKQRMAMSK